MMKYIYVQGAEYRNKPTHFMARKMVNREPHFVIVAKFTNETEAQNAVDAANMKDDADKMRYVIGQKETME